MPQATASSTLEKKEVLKPAFLYYDDCDGELVELKFVMPGTTKPERMSTELALDKAPAGAKYVQRVLIFKKPGAGRLPSEIDQYHPLDHPEQLPA